MPNPPHHLDSSNLYYYGYRSHPVITSHCPLERTLLFPPLFAALPCFIEPTALFF